MLKHLLIALCACAVLTACFSAGGQQDDATPGWAPTMTPRSTEAAAPDALERNELAFCTNINRITHASPKLTGKPDVKVKSFTATGVALPLRVLNIPSHVVGRLKHYKTDVPGWTGEYICLDYEGRDWPDSLQEQVERVREGIRIVNAKWPDAKVGIYGIRRDRVLPADKKLTEIWKMVDVLYPTHYIRAEMDTRRRNSWTAQAKYCEQLAERHGLEIIPMLDARVLRQGKDVFGEPEQWAAAFTLYQQPRLFVLWDTPFEAGEVSRLNAHLAELERVMRDQD
jgi:hypothetical protein